MLDVINALIEQASNPMLLVDKHDLVLRSNAPWQAQFSLGDASVFPVGQPWRTAFEHCGCQISMPTNVNGQSTSSLSVHLANGSTIAVTLLRLDAYSVFSTQNIGTALSDDPKLNHHPIVSVIQNTHQAAYIRKNNRFVVVNDHLAHLLEYDNAHELMKVNRVSDHFAENVRDAVRAYFEEGATVLDVCNQLVSRNNNLFDATVLGDDFSIDGEMYHYALLKNSTTARQHEQALRLSEERFRDYAHCAADWFWETDTDLNISHQPLDIAKAQGITPSDHSKSVPAERLTPPIIDIAQSGILELQKKRLPITNYEYAGKDKHGQMHHVQLNAIPVYDVQGDFVGYRGVSRDITYQKRIERSLIAAKQRAEKQTEEKSEFLASVSHELRTPLTNILGYIELLMRRSALKTDPLSEQQQNAIDIIWKNGDQLRSLINNVISIERLESGFDRVDVQSICIEDLLEEVHASFAVGVSINNSQLEVLCAVCVPDAFHTDAIKLRQILHNLVGNAVKFTERGQITVKAGFADGQLTIVIVDDGPGITACQIERLNVLTESNVVHALEGGGGLGLLLSYQYVEQLGGSISFDQGVSVGTHITITLPDLVHNRIESGAQRGKLSYHFSPEIADGPARRVRALVVDDNDGHRELLLEILRAVVDHVEEAADGIDAVSMYQSFQPDIVFLDLRMPEVDGRAVANRIRDLEAMSIQQARAFAPTTTPGVDTLTAPLNGSSCRVVALTADGLTDPANLIASGIFDDCITKPYQVSEIMSQLVKSADKLVPIPKGAKRQ